MASAIVIIIWIMENGTYLYIKWPVLPFMQSHTGDAIKADCRCKRNEEESNLKFEKIPRKFLAFWKRKINNFFDGILKNMRSTVGYSHWFYCEFLFSSAKTLMTSKILKWLNILVNKWNDAKWVYLNLQPLISTSKFHFCVKHSLFPPVFILR